MWRNTLNGWGFVSIALHWTIATLILFEFGLGWVATEWHLSPTKLDLMVWHKSFGVLVLALVAVRVVWRLANVVPLLPATTPLWQQRAAHGSHLLLYLLQLALPLSGWVINSASNFPFRVFWWFRLPAIATPSEALSHAAKLGHLYLFWALAAVLLLHIAAALDHHFRVGDKVLVQMLPLLRRGK